MSPLFVAVRRAALLCLPFATLFAVGVTPSTRVCAQALVPGWNALPRSGVTNPHPGGDYDWIGLTADLKLTDYSGSVFDYPTTPSYGGGGAGAGNRPMETTNSYIGTGGSGGNVDAHAHFTLRRSSPT